MYYIKVDDKFSSAHHLRGYKGKCENIHGHNWKVKLTVRGEKLNDIGLLIDFHDLKEMLKETLSAIDHKNINDIEQFKTINPSSENLSKYIFDSINFKLINFPGIVVDKVEVFESEGSSCTYKED